MIEFQKQQTRRCFVSFSILSVAFLPFTLRLSFSERLRIPVCQISACLSDAVPISLSVRVQDCVPI